MFELLNDMSITILDVLCFRIFYEVLLSSYFKVIGKTKSYLLFFVHSCTFFTIIELLANFFFLKEFLIILSTAIIMHFFARIPVLKSVAASAAFVGALIAIDYATLYLIYNLFDGFEPVNIGYTVAGRLIVIVERTCVLLIVFIIKMHIDKRRQRGLIETEWLRFIFFPVCTIIIAISMIGTFTDVQDIKKANVLYAIAFIMVILNISIYYLISDIVNREIAVKERELEYAQYKNQIEVYKTLEDGLERQRQYVHEFKNHILCVDSLIKDKDFDALENYLSKLTESSYLERKAIDTNNAIVNIILNEKYSEMNDKGIVFVFRINDLSGIMISDDDLVVILSNLLNNAIEACEKCTGEKSVKLKFVTEDDFLVLSVKNTFNGEVMYDGKIFQTSKNEQKEEHGIGVKNIQRTIEKYNGTCSIKYSGKEFCFSILFPLSK